MTTLLFGRSAQSVAEFACPQSPVTGLLREPHLVPVQLIRQAASSHGDAVHSRDGGMEGFSVKKRPMVGRTLGEPCSNKDTPSTSSKSRSLATDYRAFQMRENSCSRASSVGFSRV